MKEKDIERKCIATGEAGSKESLLRFVADPQGHIIPDFKKKLSGKGVYVSNSKQVLQKAIEKNLFAKALKMKAKVDEGLLERVEKVLRKSGLEAVSLAKKAGILVTGFEKVRENLKKDKVQFVLEAKDAGDDGHNKIVFLAKDLEVFDLYGSEELDAALDKVNTVHAAFLKSKMADMVQSKLEKLKTFLNS